MFGTKNLHWFVLAMVVVFGVVRALFYGAQGTLYSALYPTRTRYTGLSFVYQVSGIYASGVTPMILTALIAAAGGKPWLACGYLVATAVISVVATGADPRPRFALLSPTGTRPISRVSWCPACRYAVVNGHG